MERDPRHPLSNGRPFARPLGALWMMGLFAALIAPARADFTLLMRNADQGISNTSAAEYLLAQPASPSGGWTFTDHLESPDPATINVGGNGNYGATNKLPNGLQQDNTYALKATANLLIPAGTWTIGFGSDDGGSIKIAGITFDSRFNNSGNPADNEVRFETGRGHRWTGGTFTVAEDTVTTIEAMMYENSGGDSWELGFAPGSESGFSTANWSLLEDGVHGWTVQVAPIADLTAPQIIEVSPVDNDLGVSPAVSLTATFDEDIQLTGAGSITLVDLTNGTDDRFIDLSVPQTEVSASGRTLTIAPSSYLSVGTQYAVLITGDAVEDLSTDNNGGGNAFLGISDPTTWDFTTVPYDATPPVISSTLPDNGAGNIEPNRILSVTFDDQILLGSGNIRIYDIDAAAVIQTISVQDSSQVSFSGATLTIDPATDLDPNRDLAVQWDAGIVKNWSDFGTAAVTDTTTWYFTTSTATLSNPVPIVNPSFEDDALTPGTDNYDVLPIGWSEHNDAEGSDTGDVKPGVWYPNPGVFTNGVPDGDHIAYVEPQGQNYQGGLSQVLAAEFIHGPDYQLRVKVGNSSTWPFTGYRVQLLAGDTILVDELNVTPVPSGEFIQVVLLYEFDETNANLNGEPLEIRLLGIGYPAGGGASVDFDDVQLTYGFSRPAALPGGPYVASPSYPLELDGSGSRPADGAALTLYEWDLNNDGTFGDVANVAQPASITYEQLLTEHGMQLGNNTIALRVTDTSGLTSVATTNVRVDLASVTPGADFVVEADEDSDGDDRWEDLVVTKPSRLELLLDDSPAVTRQPVTTGFDFEYAYDFPGGSVDNEGGALLVQTDTTTARSFQNSANGDWSTKAMSMEIWFKPDNLTPAPSNGQILFEDGGGSGLGLFIVDNKLVCTQDSDEALMSYDLLADPGTVGTPGPLLLAPPTDEFIQVVLTRTQAGATIMYLNGVEVASASDNDGDWSGGDAAAFGTRGGTNTGGRGNGQANTESFDGQIAIIRVYENQILSPAQVAENFDALNTPDLIQPFIEYTSPTDDAQGVFITSDLVATFDEEVQFTGTGSVTIRNLDDGSGLSDRVILLPSSQVTFNGRDLVINPSTNLDFGTHYAVRISADAITDSADALNPFAGISDDVTWSFTTLPEDFSPPVLVGMNPPDNATGVPTIGTALEATFDDDILPGSGNIVIWELDEVTQAGVSVHATISIADATQVSIGNKVLTINPSTPLLSGKTYAVRIDAGAVTNTSYLDFAGILDDTTWNFTLNTPLFSDGFESPDVTVADSIGNTTGKVDTGKWVRATQGFGATRCGIVDEAAGDITDPTGEQAFAFRYTNSGLTTAEGVIGPLVAGIPYRISFDVVVDKGSDAHSPYTVKLVTFNGINNAGRTDVRGGMTHNTSSVLATRSGDAPAGGAYQTISFEYTADGSNPALGHDLALRFQGASTSATIDNVSVTVASTPDTTPPTLTSITDDKDGGPVVVGETVVYTVRFNEDIDAITVRADDFDNAGTATFTIGAITETSDTSGAFLVPVTPTSPGTLQLQIRAGATIRDMGGNLLNATAAINDDTIITVNEAAQGYQAWISGSFSGTLSNTDPETDFDGGGLATGVEWVLGGDPTTNADDDDIAPTVSLSGDGNSLIFTFRRAAAALADSPNTVIAVKYGSSMSLSSTAENGVDGVSIDVTPNGAGSGIDLVAVTIPRPPVSVGRLFVALDVTVSTP